MPETRILLFRAENGKVPIREWRTELAKKNKRAYAKCLERIQRLAQEGRDLRRPLAAHLDRGIYELRARAGTEQHRIFYFFHGEDAVILSHGFQKEDKIPSSEIDRAVNCRSLVEKRPELYTTQWSE